MSKFNSRATELKSTPNKCVVCKKEDPDNHIDKLSGNCICESHFLIYRFGSCGNGCDCPYHKKDICNFSHSDDDLRSVENLYNSYNGRCPYHKNCTPSDCQIAYKFNKYIQSKTNAEKERLDNSDDAISHEEDSSSKTSDDENDLDSYIASITRGNVESKQSDSKSRNSSFDRFNLTSIVKDGNNDKGCSLPTSKLDALSSSITPTKALALGDDLLEELDNPSNQNLSKIVPCKLLRSKSDSMRKKVRNADLFDESEVDPLYPLTGGKGYVGSFSKKKNPDEITEKCMQTLAEIKRQRNNIDEKLRTVSIQIDGIKKVLCYGNFMNNDDMDQQIKKNSSYISTYIYEISQLDDIDSISAKSKVIEIESKSYDNIDILESLRMKLKAFEHLYLEIEHEIIGKKKRGQINIIQLNTYNLMCECIYKIVNVLSDNITYQYVKEYTSKRTKTPALGYVTTVAEGSHKDFLSIMSGESFDTLEKEKFMSIIDGNTSSNDSLVGFFSTCVH